MVWRHFGSKNSTLDGGADWSDRPMPPIPLELPLEEPGWCTPPTDQEESPARVIEIDMC